jgi:hypothetical protein
MFEHLGTYLYLVVARWQSILALVLLLPELAVGFKIRERRALFLGAAILVMFWSMFLTWRDDQRQVMSHADAVAQGIVPRRLTDEQRSVLLQERDQLSGQSGRRTIEVASVPGSVEGRRYRDDFVDLFKALAWTVESTTRSGRYGSSLMCNSEDHIGQRLSEALEEVGVSLGMSGDDPSLPHEHCAPVLGFNRR